MVDGKENYKFDLGVKGSKGIVLPKLIDCYLPHWSI